MSTDATARDRADATPLRPWRTQAVNLPEHGDNPVHTDAGAQAAGHERALVAGTTVFVYLTHPPLDAWGVEWAERGGGEVRFRSPVFDDDVVDVVPVEHDPAERMPKDGVPAREIQRVEARSRGALRATFDVWSEAEDPGPMRGDPLPAFAAPLDDGLTGYPARAGDELVIRMPDGTAAAHPALTTVIGNRAMIASVVDGPWIHVRSRITHRGLAPTGDVALVESSIVDRFDSRAGERALLDVRVSIDGRPIWAIEHEAIVRLR